MIAATAAFATITLLFCFVTAMLDMGMNGARAGWAPWGFGVSMVCLVIMFFTGALA